MSNPNAELVFSEDKKTLLGCNNKVTEVIIPDGVTAIGDCAFFCFKRLVSVKIPDSVTTIGKCAFFGCTNLAELEIPQSVSKIEMRAFFGCKKLTSLVIPDGVVSIEQQVFGACAGLTGITIPNTITEIGVGAFYECTSLTNLSIPSSVTKIEADAFEKAGCEKQVKRDYSHLFDFEQQRRMAMQNIVCENTIVELRQGNVFDAKSLGADGLVVFYCGLSAIRVYARQYQKNADFNAAFKFVRYIDTNKERVEDVTVMHDLIYELLNEFANHECRVIAMNGIRVYNVPDIHTRPESYQIQFIKEWLTQHPRTFDKIMLIDLRGGFNHADERI